jgi:hypothetical protein
MKHFVVNLIGLVAGVAGGLLLVPEPIRAALTATHVSWDGSQCPAGDYTITSTASNLQSGESFQATATGVRLPSSSVGLDFSNLPGGTYRVIAHAGNPDGDSFESQTQTLTVAGGTPAPQELSDGTSSGRRRPSDTPATGTAQPRLSATGSSQAGGSARSTAQIGVANAPITTNARTAVTRVQAAVSLEWALEALARLTTGAHAGSIGDVAVVDEDGDGSIDYIRITIGAGVVIWRIDGRN